jgi:hypothetical protein
MLTGYKTYLVAGALLAAVAVEKFLGFDVPGFDVPNDWLLVVLNGLGLASLRAAISKYI